MFLILSQGPQQTLERLPTHNHRRVQMFEILMFTKTHTQDAWITLHGCVFCRSLQHFGMETHTQTSTHIQNLAFTNDADTRYQRPDQPIKNLWPFYSEITEASSKIKTNCPCVCVYLLNLVCDRSVYNTQREKVFESEWMCVRVIVQTLTRIHYSWMCVNSCQKHIVQTKAISQCVGVCVCTLQKHILTELLSYPSNMCYEFGLCPKEHCHMTESPDSPKQSNNPNAELHSSTGFIWNAIQVVYNSTI